MHPYVSYHLISSNLRVCFYCALVECTSFRFSQEVGGMISLTVILPSSIFTGEWEFGFWKTWRECSLSQHHQNHEVSPETHFWEFLSQFKNHYCAKRKVNAVILCLARKCICIGISGLKSLRLKNLKDVYLSAEDREHPNTREKDSERKLSSILSKPYRNSRTDRPFSGKTEFSISK